MNKAVIFDLDGTLIHSLPDILYHVNLMLEHFGYKTITEREIRPFIGYGAKRLIADAVGGNQSDERVMECLNYYNDIYTHSDSSRTVLFDGVLEVCNQLKTRGYKLALLTNKPQSTTNVVYNNLLQPLGLDTYIGSSERFAHKPDSASTNYILETLGVGKENAYFVGDGETDVLTAQNAGINSIAVLWGYRTKSELSKVGARVFANTPQDILKILK